MQSKAAGLRGISVIERPSQILNTFVPLAAVELYGS